MGLTCWTSIAGTQILFDHFGGNSRWNTWQWKLDPYRIPEQTAAQPDVVIRNGDHISDSNSGVLSNEHSGFFRREVRRTADGATLWRFVRSASDETYLAYQVSGDYQEVTLQTDRTESDGAVALEYLGQMMPAIQLGQGNLTFHAALVEYAGQSFAVCAPSGTGKTTHARLWRDCKNALILNGDRAVLRKAGDAWNAWGTPWSGTSGEQINRSAPLRALVLLQRGDCNRAERLNPMETFRALFGHLLYPQWDRGLTMKAMDLLDDLLGAVPVYRLTCRPDEEAVEALYRAMYGADE